MRSQRFGLVLSPTEKSALQRLAEQERIPAAAVVRRLVWHEAERRGLVSQNQLEQPIQEVHTNA